MTAAGEIVWCGAGSLAGRDGWVALAPADAGELLLPPPTDGADGEVHRAVLDQLGAQQALFFRTIAAQVASALPGTSDADVSRALWDLVWSGLLTNDTFAPVRALLAGTRAGTHSRPARPPRARYGRYRGLSPAAAAAASAAAREAAGGVPGRPAGGGGSGDTNLGGSMSGRWSRLPDRATDPTLLGYAAAEALLDRHGVVTRGAVVAERLSGGFAGVYPVLKAAEESGRARRGYFVDGLGAAQFAMPGAVDALRARAEDASTGRSSPAPALVLAATDPANPYGAALPWPTRGIGPDGSLDEAPDGGPASAALVPLDGALRPAGLQAPARGGPSIPPELPQPDRRATSPRARRGHQPARKAGALVVLVDGACILYVERGGKTLLSFTDDPDVLTPAADALALAVREGVLGKLAVEKADGAPIVTSGLGAALSAAGFRPTPRGLRLRG